ncbi:MAG TPA: ATP-binding cassette domain-containing protein [Gemmataceae bacterium]|nr:ATP-binding cassette domain-containing protein [Gemmataceae bacterium]
MFLICPRCLRAKREQRRSAGFACAWCQHRWEAPSPSLVASYYAELEELEICLVATGDARIPLTTFPATLGRDSDFPTLNQNTAVSRRHCVVLLDASNGTFLVRDLNSAGGTAVNQIPVANNCQVPIQLGDQLRMATAEMRLEARLRREPKNQDSVTAASSVELSIGSRPLVLAAAPEGKIVAAEKPPGGATQLAVLHYIAATQTWMLSVLDRSRVAVNGEVAIECELQPFDQLNLAGMRFVFDPGGKVLRPEEAGSGPALSLRGLQFRAGRKHILFGLDCTIPAEKLTAIVGQSGSGKTTLLRVLSGQSAPDAGAVAVDGDRLSFGAYGRWARANLAIVPQADVVHEELTVRECLDFAAALRLGPFVTAREKAARVDKVLNDLDLAGQQGMVIGKLSGGQKKRVGVAAELIAAPRLLLFDEPTTGLDYLNEQSLVAGLKQLTRQGRTVVFVTHSLATLEMVDHVIMIRSTPEEGGRVVAEGKPEVIKRRLQLRDWAELYPANATKASQVAESPGRGLLPRLAARAPCVLVLTLRYLRLWTSSRLTALGTLVLLPLALGFLVRLATANDTDWGSDRLLFGLIAAFWLGMNQSVREIVKEKHVLLREQAARVGCGSYLLSKVVVLAGVAIPQAVFLLAPLKWLTINLWTISFSLSAMECPWAVSAGMFWLAVFLGCVLGLFLSTCCLFLRAKGEAVALLLVVLVTLPQILFSAKVVDRLAEKPEEYHSFEIDWDKTTVLPRWCSLLTVSRYLYVPLDAQSRNYSNAGRAYGFNLTVLATMALLTLVLTWMILEVFVWRQRRVR